MADRFEDSDPVADTKSGIGYVVYAIILIALGFLGLTAGKALENQTNVIKFTIFSIPILAYGLYVGVVKIGRHRLKGKNRILDNLIIYVHDPELGVLRGLPGGKFMTNPFNLAIISLFITSILAFLGATFAQSSIGNLVFPFTPGGVLQQVTATANVFFQTYAAPSENAWLYIVIGMLLLVEFTIFPFIKLLLPFATRRGFYTFMILPNAIISGFIWRAIHILVSGAAEDAQLSHLIFGINNALLVMFTGSIIPSEAYHIVNNVFNAVKLQFGNELLIFAFVGALAIIGVVILLRFIFRSKK